MPFILNTVGIEGILRNFHPLLHIRAHGVHDALERHPVLYEFRIRIEAGVEQMIFSLGFDDRAGITVEILLAHTSMLQHFPHFLVVYEIACA